MPARLCGPQNQATDASPGDKAHGGDIDGAQHIIYQFLATSFPLSLPGHPDISRGVGWGPGSSFLEASPGRK